MNRNSSEFLNQLKKSGAIFGSATVDGEGTIIVDSLRFPEVDKVLTIDASLICRGNIDVHDMNVKGSLTCEGYLSAECLAVKGSLYCKGDVDVGETTVLKTFICKGNIYSNGQKIMVYKDFVCEGNCEADVVAMKKFICNGVHIGKLARTIL